jgi:hypothetical protein
VPPAHKEVQVDPKLFDDYAGQYALTPALPLSITREADKLWLQATSQPKVELFPESSAKFFMKVVDAKVTFVKDATGKVTHLILHQSGDHEAKKIK